MSFGIRYVMSAAILTAAFAQTASATEIVLSHGYSPTHVIAAHGIEPWKTCVETAVGDELSFNYFPSGQIASVKDSLDALNNGLAGATAIAIGYESSRLPLNGVTMLPDMGETSVAMATAYRTALSNGPLADELASNGIHPVFNIMLPVYQIVSAVGPIKTIEDFKGKVVRSGGGAMNFTIQAVGASPAEIPSSDMYVAMERKTVDATLSALSSVRPYKLDELVNAISSNGRFGTFATVFGMNKDVYNALSDSAKSAVDSCGATVEADLAAFLDQDNAALQTTFADKGIEIYEFPTETMSAMEPMLAEVSKTYIDRLSSRGLAARGAYDAYRAALGK